MARGAEVAILFADVCGSTRLYESLGNEPARKLVARSVALMREATIRHAGTVIKTIGDEVMSVFPSADAAALAAADMQDSITAGRIHPRQPIAIRVGFHYGSVLLARGDAFGDAVNVAALISRQAKPAQILTSGEARARMTGRTSGEARHVASLHLKGKQGTTELHEIVWQAEEATVQSTPTLPRQAATRLVLTINGAIIELGDPRPVFTFGRDERNDIVLAGGIVSRHHARVDYSNGRFVLTDQSANGTFLVPDGGAEVHVHRDSAVLAGSGRLGIGARPEAEAAVVIRYEAG